MSRQLTCVSCPSNNAIVYDNVDTLEAHIAAIHVHHFEYNCRHCPYARFCTESILHDHYLAVHQCNQHELRIMTQRAHVRSLLIESLKNAWTNSVVVDENADNVPNDDRQTIATSAICTSYDDEMENEQLNSSETKPNVSISPIDLISTIFATPNQQQHRSSITGNMQVELHRNEIGKINKRPRSLPTGNTKKLSKRERAITIGITHLKCMECDRPISKVQPTLRRHASLHLNKIIYECKLCDHKCRTTQYSDMRNHVNSAHPGNDYATVILSNSHKYCKELADQFAKCFGYEYKVRKLWNNDDKIEQK